MSDYASLKVPDLKKLLSERSLPQSGNKADLIARLQEHDKNKKLTKTPDEPGQAEDVIDWDDDDTKTAPVATTNDDSKPAPAPAAVPAPAAAEKETPATAAPAPAPAKAESANPAPAAEAQAEVASGTEPNQNGDEAANKTDTEKPAETASFAAGLSATDLEKEKKKRAERALRFGIQVDENSDESKKVERAQRFGIEASAVPKGLDEALPERRPKRGRDGDDGQGDKKRRSLDPRNGGRGRQNQNNKGRAGRAGGDGGRAQRQGASGGGAPQKSILDDPEERAKAERRAARFGGGK
ncbi:hypothetical protein N0V82_007958 [Gnomoniopsis sp. IMI 355080]|nr:hypothetical protein N0V82_007958 [Gnomoniopsis sp. IMI 355080]